MEFFDLIRKILPAIIKVQWTQIRCEDRKPISNAVQRRRIRTWIEN